MSFPLLISTAPTCCSSAQRAREAVEMVLRGRTLVRAVLRGAVP